jgi:hypothetical protein
MLQFLRLILCIVLIPIGFSLATGNAVGSSTGAVIGGAEHVLTLADWAILIVAGALGAWARLQGAAAGLHGHRALRALGARPLPRLGRGRPARLAHRAHAARRRHEPRRTLRGRSPRILIRGFQLAGINVAAMLVLSTVFATVLYGIVGERWEAVFLAFAPGGLAEMALVALSLEISVIYVTVHHILRIILAVLLARPSRAGCWARPPRPRPPRAASGARSSPAGSSASRRPARCRCRRCGRAAVLELDAQRRERDGAPPPDRGVVAVAFEERLDREGRLRLLDEDPDLGLPRAGEPRIDRRAPVQRSLSWSASMLACTVRTTFCPASRRSRAASSVSEKTVTS